jgi:hypothetical protein
VVALGAGDGGARVLHLVARGGDLRDVAGRGDGHVRVLGLELGARLRQLRLGAVERHLVIARIDFDQHRAGTDGVVVVDQYLDNRARHPRGDLRDVPVDLRIVGRFVPPAVQPEGHHPDEDHDRGNRDQPQPAAAGRGLDSFLRHYCRPPR